MFIGIVVDILRVIVYKLCVRNVKFLFVEDCVYYINW